MIADGRLRPEVVGLIYCKMASLMQLGADRIKHGYYDQAWAYLDEVNIYREALSDECVESTKFTTPPSSDYCSGKSSK